MKPDDRSERLLSFAVAIGRIVDSLPDTQPGRHVAGQLIRCGTSPAPNYEEACAAESRADFIHKIGICLKELRESRLWLRPAQKAALMQPETVGPVLKECCEGCSIIARSRITALGIKNKPRNAGPN